MRRSSALILIVLISASAIHLQSEARFSYEFEKVAVFLALHFDPLSWGQIGPNLPYLGISLLMSLAGTGLAFALAIPYSFVSWQSRSNRLLRALVDAPLVAFRTIPDLVIALVLVLALGFGPAVGALAVGLGSFAVVSTMLTDLAIANSRFAPHARNSGSSSFQIYFGLIVRQSKVEIIELFLFRFEVHFRLSTFLGLVGVGGIGELLQKFASNFQITQLLVAVAMIALSVLALELVSRRIMSLLRRAQSEGSIRLVANSISISTMFSMLILLISHPLNLRPPRITELIMRLANPDFTTWSSQIWLGLIDSLSIAFTAGPLAFLVGVLLAAGSSSKFSPFGRSFGVGIRMVLAILRSVPTLVWALLTVTSVGFGLGSGFIAATLGLTFFVAKYVAPIFDEPDSTLVQSMRNSGASSWQLFLHIVLFEKRVRVIDSMVFVLDVAMRYSLVMGIVGAGGIGSLLLGASRAFDFSTLSAILIILVTVVGAVQVVLRVAPPKTT